MVETGPPITPCTADTRNWNLLKLRAQRHMDRRNTIIPFLFDPQLTLWVWEHATGKVSSSNKKDHYYKFAATISFWLFFFFSFDKGMRIHHLMLTPCLHSLETRSQTGRPQPATACLDAGALEDLTLTMQRLLAQLAMESLVQTSLKEKPRGIPCRAATTCQQVNTNDSCAMWISRRVLWLILYFFFIRFY